MWYFLAPNITRKHSISTREELTEGDAHSGQEIRAVSWGGMGKLHTKGRIRGNREVCLTQHNHILRLPATTVTKKNKFLYKSSVTTPKYDMDDKDNQLPLDNTVTPKKVTP